VRPPCRQFCATALAVAAIIIFAAASPVLGQSARPAHHEVEPPPEEPPAVPPIEVPPGFGRDYDEYLQFKQALQDATGIEYSLAVSVLPQWAGPPATNFVYTPWISWTPFSDSSVGSGAFVFSFQRNQYWSRTNGTTLQARSNLLTPPSDWGGNFSQLAQLSYTQTLPGQWRWLSATVGQYSFGLYDRNEYAGDAQFNFVNYALAQNGTQAYVGGDLGAYAQAAAPDREWTLAGGFQGATNLGGSGLSTRGIATGKLAYFVAAQASPNALGGSYSLLWYVQPAVPAMPTSAQGISFNAVRNISRKLGLFLRVNHASGLTSAIETSLGWGIVINEPLARRPLDQVGLGFAWNETNLRAVDEPARGSEFVSEVYYSYAVFQGLRIGPDVQLYADRALARGAGPAAVLTLRGTAIF
jgi:Carbohydrate-selective porin, OprB family